MRNGSTVLERVIRPKRGDLSPGMARQFLSLDFPPGDHARYERLSAKASEGALSEAERAELEEYLDVNDFLTIIKAKARASLQRRRRIHRGHGPSA